MVSTTPPSTRSAAPVVAEAWGEATKTTMFATSSGVAARRMIELGRLLLDERHGCFLDRLAGPLRGVLQHRLDTRTASGRAGPHFTVTPVPAARLARRRETARLAVLVTP